ncbi:hypothetical protein B0H19DRAFT_1255138 [Mycena capillaripes]|nr:hypothetical protein B0H19DRAFT_1255138 [Mycena capillaripes]
MSPSRTCTQRRKVPSPSPSPAPPNRRPRAKLCRPPPQTTQWPDLPARKAASRPPIPLQMTQCPDLPARGATSRPPLQWQMNSHPLLPWTNNPPARTFSLLPVEGSVAQILDSPGPFQETPAAANEQPLAASVDEQPPARTPSPSPAEDSVAKVFDLGLAVEGDQRASPPCTEDAEDVVAKDMFLPPFTALSYRPENPSRRGMATPLFLMQWRARRAADANESAPNDDGQGFCQGSISATLRSLNSLMAPSSTELDLRSHLQLPAHSAFSTSVAPTPLTPTPLAPTPLISLENDHA